MRKSVLFCILTGLLVCMSCEKDPWEFDHLRPPYPESVQNTDNQKKDSVPSTPKPDDVVPETPAPDDDTPNTPTPNNTVDEDVNTLTITKLYSVVMRRELPYPFQAYVLQVSDGAYFYMMRYRYNKDLKVGDKISFSVYSFCPNEIAQINGYDLGDGSEAVGNVSPGAGEYLVASDAIEATVKSTFDMDIRYTITFWPISTKFIETTSGNLVFVKNSKLNVDLKPGDRIVYNVYTLFPNEILAIKKL